MERLCRQLGGGPLGPAESNEKPKELLSPPQVLNPKSSDYEGQSYSVQEVLRLASEAIAQGFPRPIWVIGEVQNFRATAKGIFFSLAEADDRAGSAAVSSFQATLWESDRLMWADPARKLELRDGLKVRMLVQIRFYQQRGMISAQVLELDPNYTLGQLAYLGQKSSLSSGQKAWLTSIKTCDWHDCH